MAKVSDFGLSRDEDIYVQRTKVGLSSFTFIINSNKKVKTFIHHFKIFFVG